MKIVKSRRRRKVRAPNAEKVFAGFVRALAQLKGERPRRQQAPQSVRSGS